MKLIDCFRDPFPMRGVLRKAVDAQSKVFNNIREQAKVNVHMY